MEHFFNLHLFLKPARTLLKGSARFGGNYKKQGSVASRAACFLFPSRWSRRSTLVSEWQLGRKGAHREKRGGGYSLYVYKCQKAKACNPFRRCWRSFGEPGATPAANNGKVLTPSCWRWALSPELTPGQPSYTHTHTERHTSRALRGLFRWCSACVLLQRYILSGVFHFILN